MPAPAGTKRVRNTQVFRPFVFGSVAHPINPDKKPADLPAEHTHKWTVWVKGVDGEDITYWLKKVQFKLHETYANALRTVEAPPFEVTETGWGEFEIQIKLYFVSESNEKPQTLWHGLKLHPYGPDAEGQKERGDAIVSQNYEEVLFNEPAEQFFDILTGGGGGPTTNKGKTGKTGKAGKGAKFALQQAANGRTAEIPYADSPGNPYSKKAESDEIDRLKQAFKTVEAMKTVEQARLVEREKKLEALRKTEGVVVKKK